MTTARTRLRLALGGVALLLTVVVALVARGVMRRAAQPAPASAAPVAVTPARSASPAAGPSLMERVLSAAAQFERLHYQGGTRARLERLQIPIGDAKQKVEIASADLQLDVSSMSLKGVLDGAPIARSLIASRLPFLELGAGALPIKLDVPARSLGTFAAWSVSADLAGQRLAFRPNPALRSLPMQLSRGRLGFDNGRLSLEDIELRVGASRIGINAGLKDALGKPVFDRTALEVSLNLIDFLLPPDKATMQPPTGRVGMRVEVSGPADHPEILGSIQGGLEIPSLPIALETAGVPDRRVVLRFPRIEGHMNSGKNGVLLAAEIETGEGEASFYSRLRRVGFRGAGSRAVATLEGAWSAPRLAQTLELKRGQLEYAVLPATDGTRVTTGTLSLPYESMRFATATRGDRTSYGLDATLPDGGLARFGVEIDRARKPAGTSYTVDTRRLDLTALTASLFHGLLAIRGQLTMKASGRADRMTLASLRGTGGGTLAGFSIDLRTAELSLEDLDLADLIRAAEAPSVTLEAPTFARELLLRLSGGGAAFRVKGELALDANLRYRGRFEYTFDPAFLAAHRAGEAALLRRGGGNRLALRIQGEPGKPGTIDLGAP